MTFFHFLKRRFISILFTLFIAIQVSACGTGSNLTEAPADSSSGPGTETGTGNNGTFADIVLSWVAPAEREDNSSIALSEIAGYRVHYGQAHDQYSSSVMISDGTAVGYTLTGLSSGTYYLVITTIDTEGRESQFSPEVTIAI